jgi:hypothetical protein
MRCRMRLFLLGFSFVLPLTSTALAQQPELGTFTTVDFPDAISTGGTAVVPFEFAGAVASPLLMSLALASPMLWGSTLVATLWDGTTPPA